MTTKTQAQIENAEATTNRNVRIVKIENPIVRGEQSYTEITLNKPTVGTLRGLSLQDVLKWDVNAINKLLTRITTPALNEPEIDKMDISDYTSIAVELTSFLVSAQAISQTALTT